MGPCFFDLLAQTLSSNGWRNVFGQHDSDGIVPVTSQVAGRIGSGVAGIIHSSDLSRLGFTGPGDLDANTFIPATVIHILNLPASDQNGFYKLAQSPGP